MDGQGTRAQRTGSSSGDVIRRHMKVIGYLGKLDDVFGATVTTRSWNTFAAIAKVLGKGIE